MRAPCDDSEERTKAVRLAISKSASSWAVPWRLWARFLIRVTGALRILRLLDCYGANHLDAATFVQRPIWSGGHPDLSAIGGARSVVLVGWPPVPFEPGCAHTTITQTNGAR